MGIQIFGTKKCQETRKAERFFKERNISFQFIDLAEKGMSKGELESVKATVKLENLIDRNGKEFQKRNLKFMAFDIAEELLKNPLLFATPVVRDGRKATVGYQPEVWKAWLD